MGTLPPFLASLQVPAPLHPALRAVAAAAQLDPACATELLGPVGEWTAPCVKLAVSKALSLGILGAGLVVKAPQIAKIVRARSAAGLSVAAYALESVASGIFVAYSAASGFPFTSYGEGAFLVLQNAIILALMAAYAEKHRGVGKWVALVAGFGGLSAALARAPASVLAQLQSVALPISAAAKLPQIVANARAGHTGQLSAVTVVAYFAGSCARVFTTLQEVGDPLVLVSFLVNGALNAMLLAQVLWYWNARAPSPKPKKLKTN